MGGARWHSRLLWILACSIVAFGATGTWLRYAHAIEAIDKHARVMYDQANADDAEVRRGATLRQIQTRLRRDERAFATQYSIGALTAVSLRLLQDVAQSEGVEVRTVAPDAVPASGSAQPNTEPLRPIEVQFGVRGAFSSILAFVDDLPKHNVLVDVHDISFAVAGQHAPDKPVLDATIHATLFRLVLPSIGEI